MKPQDCSAFQVCNAPICPLDPLWRVAVHLAKETVCRYLLAGRKAGAADYYRDDPIFAAVQAQAAEVCYRHRVIARAVERAARSGLRGQNLRKPLSLTTDQEGQS
jgi:hypothetical protein